MVNDTFKIPKNSFTAFRLTYLPAEEISETSKSILIGNSPYIYDNDQGPGLVKGTVRKAKSKARRTFDSTLDTLTKSVYRDENLTHNKYRLHDSGRFDHIISDIENSYLQDSSDSSDNDDVSVTEMEWNDSLGMNETGRRTVDDESTESTPSLPTLDSQSIQIPMILEPPSIASSIERVDTNYTYAEVESKLSTARNVKFRSNSRRNSRIEIAHPEPMIDIALTDRHSVLDEREHHKLRRRFKDFAKFSTGKAKHRTKDLRYKIFKGIMKTYQVGEIILKEKILVLTKSTLHNTHLTNFDENEPCDTRVQEHWREYVALLRKSDHNSIVIQLYKSSERQEKPDHEYDLTSKLSANFYSLVDKSISLTIPRDNWCLIHILKFHDNMRSVRWLYFIKQVLGDVLDSTFDIFIPELKMSLNVNVPESVVLESIKEKPFLKIQKLESGYTVKHTALIQHLFDSIKQQIIQSKNPDLLQWLESTSRPWFCFKHYDRLEWIFDDSEIFFIKNQIFKPKFRLEIRDMTNKRVIRFKDLTPTAPLPIEGFLSRLTDIGGNEQNMFRTFYKLSYFHTCDNLLFFTQFYRALTPRKVTSLGDEVFEHCSYQTTDKNHIEWLESSDFGDLDKSAFEEFERKAQLVLKADSVIDLNQVVNIRKVPADELKLAHNLLFHMAWYGEPTKAEETYLLDSVLELTTLNEGKIKLQAPNQHLRDIWYDRLTSIAGYWKIRKQVEVEMINDTRNHNLKILNIDEFVDSNINQETEASELQNSVANPFLNTIDNVCMSNSLMISGYLYQKYKKHSDFNKYFVALSSGNLILYSLYKRSKITGEWKRSSYYRHHLTIPLYDCYLYSGNQTSLDLLDRQKETDSTDPGNKSLPRIYGDGWKSREEESMRCFTLWFGRKRSITKKNDINLEPKNPNLIKMIRKLGVTGRSVVFMARSRQERELWVSRIYTEINRSSVLFNV
ncbi:hypothetical protein CLIB1444_11S03642 [[Candida] jaroonii]|uniref:Uncharacterized protein n=1 Tax=[Candida] jaroonii TaxID=467808 RepID=A0ACA9YE09_9ASCO|nr:hypothetical protein CLIB1444_11S03642 [[Candida] jaroonii]